MSELYYWEKSKQDIPVNNDVEKLPLASSRPLFELADSTPSIEAVYDPDKTRYSFSNDESVGYFDQLQARVEAEDYRQATNRTAVVIGESSLAGVLQFIPEDTIVIVDNSPEMCAYMTRYVEALRVCETVEEWQEMMGLRQAKEIGENMRSRALGQIIEWDLSGYEHPLNDPSLYYEASKIAREKAIIPWCADIADKKEMRKLGGTLKKLDANVTMINLTNALLVDKRFSDIGSYVKVLENLPVTEYAPILTTSTQGMSSEDPRISGYIVPATGPFFGLKNLKKSVDGKLRSPQSALLNRQYLLEDDGYAEIDEIGMGLLLSLLGDCAIKEDARKLQKGGFEFGGVLMLGPDGPQNIDIQELPPEIRRAIQDL